MDLASASYFYGREEARLGALRHPPQERCFFFLVFCSVCRWKETVKLKGIKVSTEECLQFVEGTFCFRGSLFFGEFVSLSGVVG